MARMYKDILFYYDWLAEVGEDNHSSYCISETTRRMLLSICETFYWRTRWTHAPDVDQEITDEELVNIVKWAQRADRELLSVCEDEKCQQSPFWYDSPDEINPDCDDDPDNDTAFWNAADWAVSAFLFATATPAAALTYKTIAPKIRNFFRAPSAGALCDIVVNGILYATIPTAAASNAVPVGTAIPVTIDIVAHNTINNIIPFPVPATVEYVHRLAAVGGGEPLPVQTLEIIRSRVKPATLCADVFEVQPDWETLNTAFFDCYGEDLPMAPLRQKPENPCVLQQLGSYGWADVFDYGECLAANPPGYTETEYTAQQEKAQQIQDEYEAAYDGTPQSINPNAPDDFDENSIALCAASSLYVRDFARKKVQQIDIVYAGIFAAITVASITIPGLGWGLAIGAGMLVGLASLFGGVTYATARAALTDETALDDVACCLTDSLTGIATTEVNWNAALSACGFTGGTNAAIVRDFVAASLSENYFTFLDILGTAIENETAGIPMYCPCLPAPTYFCQDFTATDGSFTPVSVATNGDWVTSEGWKPELDTTNRIRQLWITRTLSGASPVSSVKITYDATSPGSFDGSSRPVGIRGYLGPTLVFNHETTISYGTDLEYEWTGSATIDRVELILVPANLAGSGTVGGDATLKKLEVSGSDVTEWGASNC